MSHGKYRVVKFCWDSLLFTNQHFKTQSSHVLEYFISWSGAQSTSWYSFFFSKESHKLWIKSNIQMNDNGKWKLRSIRVDALQIAIQKLFMILILYYSTWRAIDKCLCIAKHRFISNFFCLFVRCGSFRILGSTQTERKHKFTENINKAITK